MTPLAPSELKSGARALIREHSPKIIFISIIYIILGTVMAELQFRLPGTSQAYDQWLANIASGQIAGFGAVLSLPSYLRPTGIPLSILLLLLSLVLDVGYKKYCLNVTLRKSGEYKDIFDGFLYVGKVLLLYFLIFIITFLWTCLLIFPGIIAHYRYRLAWYILLENPEKGVLQCMRESKQLMKGKKLDLFLLDFSFIGWTLLNYLVLFLSPLPFSLPIVLIWLTPYQGLATAAFYHALVWEISA